MPSIFSKALLVAPLLWDPASAVRSSDQLAREIKQQRRTNQSQSGAEAQTARKYCRPKLGRSGSLPNCEDICRTASEAVPQPVYPMYFFGGLKMAKESTAKLMRTMSKQVAGAGHSAFLESIGACDEDADGECFLVDEVNIENQYIKLGEVDGTVDGAFAFPLRTNAYFTCYQRGKWPIFETWLVDPSLQLEEKNIRTGTFKIAKKDDYLWEEYHSHVMDEYLRPADVDGYWAEWFGFDRGHWAPDAPFRSNAEYVDDTYYFINVSPQSACLNRGNWERLESSIRLRASPTDLGGNGNAIAVIAGPLQRLPQSFIDTTDKQMLWHHIFDFWRVAGEVLMEGTDGKDPHWIEVTWGADTKSPGHCILRGALDNDVRDRRFTDLYTVPTCKLDTIVKKNMLPELNLFLMTEAGKTQVRRGVRVPLAYYKVATYQSGSMKDKWCCWMMDQLDNVSPVSGKECLATIAENAFGQSGIEDLDILPAESKYAGDAHCAALFDPNPVHSVHCNFKDQGIGWRGNYLLREASNTIGTLERELYGEQGGPEGTHGSAGNSGAHGIVAPPHSGAAHKTVAVALAVAGLLFNH